MGLVRNGSKVDMLLFGEAFFIQLDGPRKIGSTGPRLREDDKKKKIKT
jgi:hypothetical protein